MIGQFDFSTALSFLKEGNKIKREHWGGYWFIPTSLKGAAYTKANSTATSFTFDMNKTIVACLKDGNGYVPATPYQEDILAEDWEIVD